MSLGAVVLLVAFTACHVGSLRRFVGDISTRKLLGLVFVCAPIDFVAMLFLMREGLSLWPDGASIETDMVSLVAGGFVRLLLPVFLAIGVIDAIALFLLSHDTGNLVLSHDSSNFGDGLKSAMRYVCVILVAGLSLAAMMSIIWSVGAIWFAEYLPDVLLRHGPLYWAVSYGAPLAVTVAAAADGWPKRSGFLQVGKGLDI